MTWENIANFDKEGDDVPLAEVEELLRRDPSPAPAPSTDNLHDDRSSRREVRHQSRASPVDVTSGRPHSREKKARTPPAEPGNSRRGAVVVDPSTTRNLRSASGPSQIKPVRPPELRSHSRGKGGQQPPAERGILGEGVAIDKAASTGGSNENADGADNSTTMDDGDELADDVESDRSGEGGHVAASDGSHALEIPEDIMKLYASLRTSSRAYDWRAPQGLTPRIPAKGWKTIQDIRAAHTDAYGNITSFADLQELFELKEWHGICGIESEFQVPCSPCVAGGLACHYWNRKSCTNCFASRKKCEDGVLKPPAHANSLITKGRHKGPFEPRPEQRFYALKQLEDVMGGWDKRLNAVGGKSINDIGLELLLINTRRGEKARRQRRHYSPEAHSQGSFDQGGRSRLWSYLAHRLRFQRHGHQSSGHGER